MIKQAVPKATRAQTGVFVKSFEDYQAEKEKSVELATISPSNLDDILGGFYADLRPKKKDGFYKANTMKAARSALSGHIQEI